MLARPSADLLERRASGDGHRAPAPRLQPSLAPGDQHQQVVENVSGLLVDALVGLLACGACRPPRPPPAPSRLRAAGHRGARPCRSPRAARGRAARGCARAQEALRTAPRLELAVVEARTLARVAGRSGGLDEREQRVTVAVHPQRAHRLRVAAMSLPCARSRRASGCRGAARPSRACARSPGVREREHQHLAGLPVLHDARHEPALVEDDLGAH